jgi:signal transduction histidine kinase
MDLRADDARCLFPASCAAVDGRDPAGKDEAGAGLGPPHPSAALAHARKMEALGLLAGGVAHDFNNLLHVIRNSVEILEYQDTDSESRHYLEMIRRSAERGTALTRQLLTFARRTPPEVRPFDPNEVIANVAELLRAALGGRITVETSLAQDIWPVAADPGQLETAILNLAVNARDAIDGAGCLWIETVNRRFGGMSGVAAGQARREGDFIMIAMADSGCGMPPEVRERACQAFFTTKEPGRGTGLGLSQVAGFAREARGWLEISSAEGRGTAVRIFLPRCGQMVLSNAPTGSKLTR